MAFLRVLAADVDFACAAKDGLFAAAMGKPDQFLRTKYEIEYGPCLIFRRDERLGLSSRVLTIWQTSTVVSSSSLLEWRRQDSSL